MVAAVALAALGCQRLAGLAVELAALGARSLLYVVGVVTVIWNHLHCDCGNVVSIDDAFATNHLKNLHCLMAVFFRHRLESPPLVLQLRQRRLIFRQRLESTALVRRWRCPPQQCLAVCDCERSGLPLPSSSREHTWIWRHRYRHSSAAPLQLRQRASSRRLDARLLRSYNYNMNRPTSQTRQRQVLQLCQCLHIFCCRQLRQRLEPCFSLCPAFLSGSPFCLPGFFRQRLEQPWQPCWCVSAWL